MFRSIFGGIYLDGRKESTRRKPLALLEVAPERVVIPLFMHRGGACVPMVAVGDVVAVGQPIARPSGLGASIHASISGQVEAVEPRPHPWGGEVTSVVIRSDGENRQWPGQYEPMDFRRLSPEQIITRVERGGVIGMGGAGYPTAAKLEYARDKVDTLIINAAESEPYVTADYRLLMERTDELVEGIQTLMRAAGAKHAIVALEGDKLSAAEKLEPKLKKYKLPIRVAAVPSRYPLGAEKQVIKSVTGREVPPGGTSIDIGCVVFNPATAFAVYQAVSQGKPLTHRVVTVTGGAVARPRNLWVPVGTPMINLVEAAGGFREEPDLVLMGGPMMGIAQPDLNVPVIKSTNSVVCLNNWERREEQKESVCIRCGRCVSVCPMHLMPLLVNKELSLGGDGKELDRLHTEDCMECGCCSYICPSNIPLVERMRRAKYLVRHWEQDQTGEVKK